MMAQSLTAGDVAFSINRAKTAPSDMVDLIKSVKSARAIDDHTVEVKTDGPNPILLNQLTQIFVMSEAWSKANGCEASYNWDAGKLHIARLMQMELDHSKSLLESRM